MKAWYRQNSTDICRRGKAKAPWSVHWVDPSGARKSRTIGVGNAWKRVARELAAEIHLQLVSGRYNGDPTVRTWPVFLKEYRRLEIATKSDAHRVSINGTVAVIDRLIAPQSVADLTSKKITEFIGLRMQDRGRKPESKISPATINKDLRNLKLLLTTAVDWGVIPLLPKIKMLGEPEKLKRFVTPAHFEAMYKAATEMTEPTVLNASAGEYWRALISLAFVTGWRINEILMIRRDDVDFDAGQIISRWSEEKGKRDATMFLPESVIGELQPLWRSFEARPLDWPKDRRSIYRVFMELQQAAGIDLPCDDSTEHEHTPFCYAYGFHDFRRSFATFNALNMTGPQLQQLMKHKDFSTTQKYIRYAELMTKRPDVFVPPSVGTSDQDTG